MGMEDKYRTTLFTANGCCANESQVPCVDTSRGVEGADIERG
jgi:hypothetical protein